MQAASARVARSCIFAGVCLYALLVAGAATADPRAPAASPWLVDHRYAPVWWQTAICLPDDWQKTLVGRDGELLYDFQKRPAGFKTEIRLELEGGTDWVEQRLHAARVPIVETMRRQAGIEWTQEALAVAPRLEAKVRVPVPAEFAQRIDDVAGPLRHDLVINRLRNTSSKDVIVAPLITIKAAEPIKVLPGGQEITIGEGTRLMSTRPFATSENPADKKKQDGRVVLHLASVKIPAAGHREFALGLARGEGQRMVPRDMAEAERLRARAIDYWQKLDLPYGVLRVPDPGIQAQLDSSIRNIYQAREIKDGLPAFQVGPTVYRGLWVVDGSFLMEAVAFLGRTEEARAGIQYLLGFQRDDGAIMIIEGHWKETGIALWAVTRHARLTGDRAWLGKVWPHVEKGFASILAMRDAMKDPKSPNYGLIPDGFSDGGLRGKFPEYTNVYWTMVGMRAAVDAARWLRKGDEAQQWQQAYDEFYSTFRRAAARDMKTDAQGNRCLPIRMVDPDHVPPQKAQWAFLHAVFPGKLFAVDDPLVRGNMAMLRAAECEGLVLDTGWVDKGLWNYFGSFYAHAWLWTGEGQKAAETLYAFANHASPLLVWREEQRPVGMGPEICGDMPHNWASAEFVRLVRHLLVLERGDELHLLEGLPRAWLRPGAATRVQGVLTEFGPMNMELRVAPDARRVVLVVDPPRRNPPKKVFVHLGGWSGTRGTIELPTEEKTSREISLPQAGLGAR